MYTDAFFYDKKYLKYRSLFIILIIVLTCFYYMFSSADEFQADSESLVTHPIYAGINNIEIDHQYGLGRFSDRNDKSGSIIKNEIFDISPESAKTNLTYSAYISQIGIQGFIAYGVGAAFQSKITYSVLRFICCLAFIIVSYLIVIELRKKYGLFPAVVYWAVLLKASWLQNFAPNLYWIMFTWFLPMLLGLLCLNHENKRRIIYPLFFVSVFFKCLCGYEYISTIMMSGIAFLAAEWLIRKKKRKELFKCIFISGICMLLGFILAFLIHAFIYGDGSLSGGITELKHWLVDRRTFGNAADFDPVYSDSLNASIFDVIKMYLWDYSFGRKMLWLFIASSAAAGIQLFVFKRKSKLFVCMLICFLGTLSWIVLGKSHQGICRFPAIH